MPFLGLVNRARTIWGRNTAFQLLSLLVHLTAHLGPASESASKEEKWNLSHRLWLGRPTVPWLPGLRARGSSPACVGRSDELSVCLGSGRGGGCVMREAAGRVAKAGGQKGTKVLSVRRGLEGGEADPRILPQFPLSNDIWWKAGLLALGLSWQYQRFPGPLPLPSPSSH